MNLEIYKLIDIKVKSLIKILNADYELNNINKMLVYNNALIKSDGSILIYIDYEDDNGVHGADILVSIDNFKSLDKLYKELSNI